MIKALKDHCKTVLLYLLLATIMTFPVVLHMTSHIAGQGGDPWQTMWRFTVKGEQGLSGFIQDITGQGDPQLVNLSIWPWMPVHMALGEPLGYNVIFLLSIILSGYAMAIFVRMLVRAPSLFSSAPILAGVVYMFAPFHIAHAVGHFGAMQLQWIPFIMALGLSYIRNQRIWKIVLLGVLITIQAWEEHHYAVWLGIFAVIAGVVYFKEFKKILSFTRMREFTTWMPDQVGHDTTSLRRLLFSLFIFSAILIFGVVVPYIPTLKLASQDSNALALGIEQTIRFSADLFSFIMPSSSHPLWGGITHNLFSQYFTGNDSESTQYLGIPILIAILFFSRHVPTKQRVLWIATGIFFLIIALGPKLHVFGDVTGLSLPYAFLAKLPVFSAIRTVARAGVFISFSTAVLFGWVVAVNTHRTRTAVIIAVVILLDFMFAPFPKQSAMLSPAYTAITGMVGKTLIEIPASTNYTIASRALFAETLTKKRTLGNIALERGQLKEDANEVKLVPGIRQLLYLRTTELTQDRPEFFQQDLHETLLDTMKYKDASVILVHTDSLSPFQNNAIDTFLSDSRVFQKTSFGDANIYTMKDSAKDSSDGVFLMRHDGFSAIGYNPKLLGTFATIKDTANFSIVNLLDKPMKVELIYTLTRNAKDALILQDSSENEITSPIIVHPGQTVFTLKNTDTTPAILKDPIMRVIPL